MPSPNEDIQPTKRGPGRPRKAATTDVGFDSKPALPPDERVGLAVDDPRWTSIAFQDGRAYRVEDGKIVERIR
jgi:hypothetical protein